MFVGGVWRVCRWRVVCLQVVCGVFAGDVVCLQVACGAFAGGVWCVCR